MALREASEPGFEVVSDSTPRELELAAQSDDQYCQIGASVTNHRGGNAAVLRTEMWWSTDSGLTWFRVAAQERVGIDDGPQGIEWFDLQVKIPPRFQGGGATPLTGVKGVLSVSGGTVNTRLRVRLSDVEIDHRGQF